MAIITFEAIKKMNDPNIAFYKKAKEIALINTLAEQAIWLHLLIIHYLMIVFVQMI